MEYASEKNQSFEKNGWLRYPIGLKIKKRILQRKEGYG